MILVIDIIDACQLMCSTCPRGLRDYGGLANTSKKMPLETFKGILKKAISEGIAAVELYNWNEPFLNKELHKYVTVVKEYGLGCMLSSNLSLQKIDNLKETLINVDVLFISVSGYDQEIYEINHVGGNFSYIRNNIHLISELKHSGAIKTQIELKFLKFDYNHDQEEKLRQFAAEYGIEFNVYAGKGKPLSKEPLFACTEQEFLNYLQQYNSNRPLGVCELLSGHVAINADGNVFLCCARPNYPVFKIGHYLDLTKEEIAIKRQTHPMCYACNWKPQKATSTECNMLVKAFKQSIGCPEGVPQGGIIKRFIDRHIVWRFNKHNNKYNK